MVEEFNPKLRLTPVAKPGRAHQLPLITEILLQSAQVVQGGALDATGTGSNQGITLGESLIFSGATKRRLYQKVQTILSKCLTKKIFDSVNKAENQN